MKRELAIVLLAACGGGGPPKDTVPKDLAVETKTGPEISTSVGEDNGIVVLWPRLHSSDTASRDLAAQIQQRLAAIAQRTGKQIDTRPEPQRVCPRSGCKAIALGAALVRRGDACVVIATVSPPGPSDATIVPWVGDMILKSPVAAFREPPEPQVQVKDYVPCTGVVEALAAREPDVETALAQAGN